MRAMRVPTIHCILCNGLVAYTKQDRERFNSHMSVEHGASGNLDYLLAGCLMHQEERNVVAAIIEEREETGPTGNADQSINQFIEVTDMPAEEEESVGKENAEESESEVEEVETCSWKRKSSKPYHSAVQPQESLCITINDTQPQKKRRQLEEVPKQISEQNGTDTNEGMVGTDVRREQLNKKPEGRIVARKSTASKKPAGWKGAFAPPVAEEGGEGEEKMSETKAVKSVEVSNKDGNMMTEKQRIVKECPYFKERSNEVSSYNGKDQLVAGEQLPAGWMVGERTLGSGRKLSSFVEPGRQLAFRSRVCVLEYVRWQGGHSEAELEALAKALGKGAGKRRSL